jgi:hypothetical protein
MNKFQKIQKEIREITKKSGIEEDARHSILTHEWLLKLNPDVSEELQIAALAHDIDRAVRPRVLITDGESYDGYKQRHAKRSAELIAKLMRVCKYSPGSINKVKRLVALHEVSGDEEIDLLRDADSIAFFDYNINFYLRRKGADITKEKIVFMFARASNRAKQVIKELEYSPDVKEVFDSVLVD